MARKTSPEERALWREAVRDAEPYAPEPPPPPAPAPVPRHAREAPAPARAAPPNAGLDRRSAERLRRGEMAIAARLDLHGMTQEEAHRALVRFIEASYEAGRRALLLITGKGGSDGEGVLRRAVPRWLAEPRCRALVLASFPARPRHGGDGALYVLVRRKR
jgi:DNA-nicking Smr family endonuclease